MSCRARPSSGGAPKLSINKLLRNGLLDWPCQRDRRSAPWASAYKQASLSFLHLPPRPVFLTRPVSTSCC
jgi:hypothetical protein